MFVHIPGDDDDDDDDEGQPSAPLAPTPPNQPPPDGQHLSTCPLQPHN